MESHEPIRGRVHAWNRSGIVVIEVSADSWALIEIADRKNLQHNDIVEWEGVHSGLRPARNTTRAESYDALIQDLGLTKARALELLGSRRS